MTAVKAISGLNSVGKGGRYALPLNHCLVDRYAAGQKRHPQIFRRSKSALTKRISDLDRMVSFGCHRLMLVRGVGFDRS